MAKELRTIDLFVGREADVESEPNTDERAEDILRHAKPFLDSQKRFWRERIISLFKLYIYDKISVGEIRRLSVADGGLFWAFHKDMLEDMCLAFEDKGDDWGADKDKIVRKS